VNQHYLPYLFDCKPTLLSDFSLSENAPRLRIGVIHEGFKLQVSFTGWACEAYSVVVFCVDFIVGKICIVCCVPYNLFIFNMKQNHLLQSLLQVCGLTLHGKASCGTSLSTLLRSVRFWTHCMAHRMMLCGRTVIKNYQMMTLVTQGLVADGRQS
jgi:hypothetical protein